MKATAASRCASADELAVRTRQLQSSREVEAEMRARVEELLSSPQAAAAHDEKTSPSATDVIMSPPHRELEPTRAQGCALCFEMETGGQGWVNVFAREGGSVASHVTECI